MSDAHLAHLRNAGHPVPEAPGLQGFVAKLKAAWQIFFPEKPPVLTPKDEGKNRLRMILVADRWDGREDKEWALRECTSIPSMQVLQPMGRRDEMQRLSCLSKRPNSAL